MINKVSGENYPESLNLLEKYISKKVQTKVVNNIHTIASQ